MYPVEIAIVESAPLSGYPWIRPSDLLQSMARMNDLSRLLGGMQTVSEAEGVLTAFWKRYRDIFPAHQLWKDVGSGRKKVSQCLPCYIHGDEGTTYRKCGVLILSWQSAFGMGCSKRDKEVAKRATEVGASIPLNFIQTGLQTRLLSMVCPKEWRSAKTPGSCHVDKFHPEQRDCVVAIGVCRRCTRTTDACGTRSFWSLSRICQGWSGKASTWGCTVSYTQSSLATRVIGATWLLGQTLFAFVSSIRLSPGT